MKKDFKQWKDDYGLEFEPNYSKETELDCKAAFEAGQQSKQDEVDELQKRIDEVLIAIGSDYFVDVRVDYSHQIRDIRKILKGDLHES